MAGYVYPTPEQMAAYATSLNAGTPGGPMLAPNSSSLTAPAASLGGTLARLRTWLGIRIIGADAGRVLFPPQQPLQPIAQGPDQFAAGRPWDYPVGYNTRVMPRDGQPVSFAMLKNFAVGYDLLAVMIDRIKGKVVSQQWSIGPKDEKKGKPDKRSTEVQKFFDRPDKEHNFDEWCRMLLDQVIMYDAPAIWLRPTRGGDLYSLELLDGSMITPKIGPDGRIPSADMGPGYQQVIKGLPAVDYIKPLPRGIAPPLDPSGFPYPELFYRPRNPRVDSLYGYGPVEQMITTISIALRREAFLLSFYTDGSTPDLLLSVPKEWNPDQIARFQGWFDAKLMGNLPARRGATFVPDGVKVVDTKEGALTDETDQWLVRIMCFALGLNPMPFIKQMNKGQEKTHHDEAAAEGFEPWLEWTANQFTNIIELKFGYDDICFRWKEDEETDQFQRAQIEQIMVNAKIYHPDEIRQQRGDEPMADDLREQMDMATFSATPNATILSEDQQADKQQAALDIVAAKPAPVIGQPGAPAGATGGNGGAPAPAVAGKYLGKGSAGSRRSRANARLY